jgi:formate hydrogenlyase subunit 6/NADH:ubiquinone oxidoreductase subunit I
MKMKSMKKVVGPEYNLGDKIKTNVYAVGVAMQESVYPHTMTVFYPRERKKMPNNYRGFILFEPDKCISCFNCSFVELPEIIREDKKYVEYEIEEDDLHLKRTKGEDYLFVEVPPPIQIPMVSQCIDRASCIGCRVCEEMCESGAISSSADNGMLRMKIDTDKCTGCGLCVKECSMQILRLVRE